MSMLHVGLFPVYSNGSERAKCHFRGALCNYEATLKAT